MLQDIEITSTPEPQAGGCCGGGACSTTDASAQSAATSQTFEVEGMTCGHCVSSVTEEISGLAGVEGVDVALVPGGRSTVTVASDSPLRVEDVRAAVSEAGYSLV
ncbi:heavy-metal-associated domain-containing protein [Agrococcus sediminis]|uniref:Heavy-metal-associated domain-containing protein n=1 Tax=Agrococcus sediminis TaxID=2599924 RepID=A0A5M8QAP1_9MICO|nr:MULTISPECIES: cation transporter [Agrococcus]KAA6432101.1 heavy-metal-associated domain-containing protein [Agrococcus sediminis]MDR7233008.1 copper chaperone CopZ [Agrococcus sp. BE272]UOW00011.1 cation transporter [Agrococcus sp. SCSIO52902]